MQTKTDAELLRAFAGQADSDAFSEIVARYGSMVYRVCFRVLANQHEAEDASQAVFMTLMRKASMLRREEPLGSWFHTVARHAALTVARARANRRRREQAAAELLDDWHGQEVGEVRRDAVLGILDEELSALTTAQRQAVILRHLQGLSEKEAAAVLGCAPHTLSCRASEGVANLRRRLIRRGCTLGVPALVAVLEAEASASVPQALIPSLVAVPQLMAAGTAAAGTGNSVIIMEGTLRAMLMVKIKMIGGGLVAAALVGAIGMVAIEGIREGEHRTTPKDDMEAQEHQPTNHPSASPPVVSKAVLSGPRPWGQTDSNAQGKRSVEDKISATHTRSPAAATQAPQPITPATDSPESSDEKLKRKLDTIIIDHIEFEEVKLFDVVRYLRKCAKNMDPDGKGVKIRYRGPVNPREHLITIVVDKIPLGEAIEYLCKGSATTYEVKDGRVVIDGRRQAGTNQPGAAPDKNGATDGGFILEDEDFDSP